MRTIGNAGISGTWIVLVVLAPVAAAEVKIPAIGQPTPFYGAAGTGVQVKATAEPTELTLEDSLIYSLRIDRLANAANVQRPDLNEIDAFRTAFQIADAPDEGTEPNGIRVFRYRLRPRTINVSAIPGLTFPYYDPAIGQPPDQPGLPFRRVRTEPIPIRVTKAKSPSLPAASVDVPDFAEVPARPSFRDVPPWAWWLALALPPFVAMSGCAIWRMRNPVGARLARQRRSRAARAALRHLSSLGRHPPADPAAVTSHVAAYLAERFDLPGIFHTPGDLAAHMKKAGADDTKIAEWKEFFQAADAARFAPTPVVTGESLIADAERLIRRQEEEA